MVMVVIMVELIMTVIMKKDGGKREALISGL